eukprot:s29_g76.t1
MPCACKKCSLCGGHHTVKTCPLPGAKRYRAIVLQSQRKKPAKGRKLRGTNPAVLRRKPKKQVQKSGLKVPKQKFRAAQRRLYSGDQVQHSNRADRRKHLENLADLIDPDVATQKLVDSGFVLKPSKCARCGLKSVQGPFARPDASPLSRYWRCDQHDCKHWMNVLQGAKWLQGVTRFRALTPSRLWHVITRYVTLTCPSRQSVASGLGAEGPKIAQLVMDNLRKLESQEGFLKQLKRPCTVYGDGAKSWKSESKKQRLCFRNVTHYKMEFTRKTKVKKKVRISGTQLLDQVWRHLKRFVPCSLSTKDKWTKRDS